MPIGVTFPFALATGSLGYAEVTNDDISAIVSNVKVLLLTNWGERPMHANLGCNFREFAFEPLTAKLRSPIYERISSQLRMWMPFLSIDKLFIVLPPDPSVPENSFRIDMELIFAANIRIKFVQLIKP